MGSRKRSAKARQISEFKAALDMGDGFNDLFAREEERREGAAAEHEAALRAKSCESKNRYRSRAEAEAAVAACAEYGTTGLHIYKCRYCNGWHLTSHPWEESE